MASTRRPSPSGSRGSQFLIFGQDPKSPGRQSCQQRKRPSLSPSEAYFVAARRLPIRPAADRPASDALVPPPVSAAPRDLSAAAGRRRILGQTQIQSLSNRLFSYRPRRSSNRARQTLPHRRHRPNVEVRLRRVAREGGASHRGRLPAPPDSRRPLQGPHGPHRQRNPLHHTRQYEFGSPGHQGRPGGWGACLGARLRICLRPERHRSSADKAQTPVDQWASRKNEPHHQGRDRQPLLLRDPRPAASPPANFVDAYNFARRLKTLRGLTPYEFICKAWTSQPQTFKLNPLQQTPGLNI